MKPAFRYSGNKAKHISMLRPLPPHKRVVEPYLGSGAFAISAAVSALGIDSNAELVAMWHWLQSVEIKRLYELQDIVFDYREDKADIREIPLLSGPERTYLRINASGVYVGQLSSWILYPQHSLPVKNTIAALDRIRAIEVICGDASVYREIDGDVVFIDPPYVGTSANYYDSRKSMESGYVPEATVELISRIQSPVIFTYGSNAPDVFPQYDWELLFTKKVPNIRRGGTVERKEYVAYINWS